MWAQIALGLYLTLGLFGSKAMSVIGGDLIRLDSALVAAFELIAGCLLLCLRGAAAHRVCVICVLWFLTLVGMAFLAPQFFEGCACFGGVVTATQASRVAAASLGGLLAACAAYRTSAMNCGVAGAEAG